MGKDHGAMRCQRILIDEDATMALGQQCAAALRGSGLVMYLSGELGSGKTTLARALLKALGVRERVKSPTYSLMETYQAIGQPVWHVDLYRIHDPGELEWLGLDALFDPIALVLVEWPERGCGALPTADLTIDMMYVDRMRQVTLLAWSGRGQKFMRQLEDSD